jgi:predicted NUDIX family phosphoesterase
VLRKQGVLSLREEGVLLALDGKTSLEEVLAVTHSEDMNETVAGEKPQRREMVVIG